MKQIKPFLCTLLALLAAQTAFGQGETKTIESIFCLWQEYGSSESEMHGLLNTYAGYQWRLTTDDPSATILTTSWGVESDTEGCIQLGDNPDKSVTFDIRNQFRIAGKVKRVTVSATGYFKSMTVSLCDNNNPLETNREVTKDNQYDIAVWWFNDYVFDFDADAYDYCGLNIRIDGATPTYISKITIEVDDDHSDMGGKTGSLEWKVEKQEGMSEISYDEGGVMKSAPPYRLTISGSGNMPDYDWASSGTGSTAPWMKFPTITELVIEDGVTSVGSLAFVQLGSLRKVILPGSVKSIGVNAFTACQIGDFTLPEGIEQIGPFAFSGNKIETLVIPTTLRNLSPSFSSNPLLTSITVKDGNQWLDSRNNCNAVIRKSDNMLMQGCKTTIIPSDVDGIGQEAFYSCYGLTELVIPNNVTSIGISAFQYCEDMETLTIGSGVTTISEKAFKYMKNLSDVYCLADPEKLIWLVNNDKDCCKSDGTTQFHVMNPAAWQAKFPNAHVQFVAIGSVETVEGDVSGDGKTDAEDVVALMKYIAGMAAGISATAADVNKDGKVDVADVVALVNLIIGK